MIMMTASAVTISKSTDNSSESVQFIDVEGNNIEMTSNTTADGEFEISTYVNGELFETCVGRV